MPTPFQPLLRLAWQSAPLLRQPAARVAMELEQMLRAADYPAQANVMRQLRLAVERGDIAEAERRFSAGDIWGGAGSVSDVSFVSPDADRRSLRLLIRLVRAFARAGMTYAPATDRASVYKKWLKRPVR